MFYTYRFDPAHVLRQGDAVRSDCDWQEFHTFIPLQTIRMNSRIACIARIPPSIAVESNLGLDPETPGTQGPQPGEKMAGTSITICPPSREPPSRSLQWPTSPCHEVVMFLLA